MKFPGLLAPIIMINFGFAQYASAEPDIANGAKLAQESCSRCHNVEVDGPFKLHPPSFASIAVYRTPDQIYGRIAFPPFHASMPQVGYMLDPTNIEDMVAYIVSLDSK